MVRPMGNVLALPPFKEMVVGFLQAQESSRWRSQVREEGENTVKGKRCGGQGLRTATHLDTRLALDTRRPRLSRLPLQREEHQSPPYILTTPHLCQK